MKSLKQCIDEWKKSWIECSECQDMFDRTKIIIYKKNDKYFCNNCL